MQRSLTVVMDPIEQIKPAKDSTLAMLLEAQRRGWMLGYTTSAGLSLRGNTGMACHQRLAVADEPVGWFELGPPEIRALTDADLVLMRRDPPVDASYLHDTQLVDFARAAGTLVVNAPQALRDCNEKLAALAFPEHCPETLVSRDATALLEFVTAWRQCVIKPLDGMGGRGIFRLDAQDPNRRALIESVTHGGGEWAMLQRYLPEIKDGDKRVILIGGEPVPWMLARLPRDDDFRGNLAAGGRGEVRPITDVERAIAAAVGPAMVERGLEFVGLDIIGDRLTEINVTSPTGIREIDAGAGINVAGLLFDRLDHLLA